MQTITQTIEAAFKQALVKVGGNEDTPVLLTEATKPEFGDFQVNGVMALAKQLKTNPRTLAASLLDNLQLEGIAAKLEIAGPGFINITIDPQYLSDYLNNLSATNHFGARLATSQIQTIVVDLSSPNLAKEMHVGHLRSTVIGDAIASVLAYLGHNVIRQNHVGDWGTQFGMLIAHISDSSDTNLEHKLSDLEVFYREAKTKFDDDSEFADRARGFVVLLQNWQNNGVAGQNIYKSWQQFRAVSLKHCQDIYNKLLVSLTEKDVAGESLYNDKLEHIVATLDQKNLLVESQGAKCVFLSREELGGSETTPFIVQKQDGGFLYSTTDLAAIEYRVNTLKASRVLYVVDARQSFHFKQLFIVAKKAGLIASDIQLEHIPFGTMMGEDGRPFKTRSGDTVKLIDLINEAAERASKIVADRNSEWSGQDKNILSNILATAAIKYADLSKNRTSDYVFSFNKMLSFDGNTAPYLLYAYTRISSLLAKTRLTHEFNLDELKIATFTNQSEHKLALHLTLFAKTLFDVAAECYPNHLCQYLYNLAGLFMQFYENSPILQAESDIIRNSRLKLCSLTAEILRTGLNLLGIQTVTKM